MDNSLNRILRDDQVAVLSKKGIKTALDLVYNFPRKYIDRSRPLDLRATRVGDVVTFIGKIGRVDILYGKRKRLTAVCHYQGMTVDLVFFQGIAWYRKMLIEGTEAAFSGAIDIFRGRMTITHPEIEILTGDEFIHTGKIIPLYKITQAMRDRYITSRVLREAINRALELETPRISDYLDGPTLKNAGLCGITDALRQIHFPENWEMMEKAKERLAWDELFFFSILMEETRRKRAKIRKNIDWSANPESSWQQTLRENLPFELTGDQQKALQRLKELSRAQTPFSALLQGDVGSGKTLVALMLALDYMEAGYQVAMMAPTEILATQHYRNFLDFLSTTPFHTGEILLGGEKASERSAKLDRLKTGQTMLLIGTHSLIQKDLEFLRLGLVIIDEQHRFGVEQRKALRDKGDNPDLMAMTATPIPRSLTLTLYGDFETILIKEKPPGRKPVDTRLFPETDLPRLYKGIKKYVDQGRQAYIVYALIEEGKRGSGSWASIMNDYQHLEQEVFEGYRLGLLHGKLTTDEKEKAMMKFKEGLIQILVSTTVIEVGVDVPNATVMMIRNAEKFGLSQLHQLRGRVGRGSEQSFCILVESDRTTAEADARLNAMLESEDGFYLSQKDLEIRGPGELLGIRQAGESEFIMADLRIHGRIVEQSRQHLLDHPELFEKITGQKGWKGRFKKSMVFLAGEL